jgi:UPF0716 protein FxsA
MPDSNPSDLSGLGQPRACPAEAAAALQLFYNGIVFLRLLLIFIIVPILELMVIIEVSSRIGLLYTFLSLLLISFAGAALAKQQGYQAVARIREEMGAGRMPGDSLIDGGLVLAGALMLLTPGYLTDAAGLLLLLPPARKAARAYVKRRIQRAISRRTVRVYSTGGYPHGGAAGGPEGSEPEQRRRELED